MGNSIFYEVFLLSGEGVESCIYKVLFYTSEVQWWREPKQQANLRERFIKSSHYGEECRIVDIQPVNLDYFDSVVG